MMIMMMLMIVCYQMEVVALVSDQPGNKDGMNATAQVEFYHGIKGC